jgi:AAA15 family ATPase/GTPase
MLVQFTVENFRSIKEPVTMSLASGTNNEKNVYTIRDYKLLTSAAIYGANGSGKSNILSAFKFMRSLVLNTTKVIQSTDVLPHDPFRLSAETEGASSTFEVVFFHRQIKYRYGFEADKTTVFSEWLFADEKGKEAKLFFRDIDDGEFYVNTDKFKEGVGIKVLPNSLFLWRCDQNGGEISKSVLEWFNQTNYINGLKPSDYLSYTLEKMENEDFRSEVLKLVRAADLGIEDITIEDIGIEGVENKDMSLLDKLLNKQMERIFSGRSAPSIDVIIKHKKFENKHESGIVNFELDTEESEGTRKFFCLSAPFIDTLRKGKILFVDELESSLHPLLTSSLISLFNDPAYNKNGAQLIFATHDTNLLNQELFHKSQIWFTEKDSFSATHLTSLVEFKNIRPTDNIERNYIHGKYGAIPYLGSFSEAV